MKTLDLNDAEEKILLDLLRNIIHTNYFTEEDLLHAQHFINRID